MTEAEVVEFFAKLRGIPAQFSRNRHAYFEERKAAHTKLGEWLAPIVNGSDANGNISFDGV